MNSVLCTDPKHPVWPQLEAWCSVRGLFLTHLVSRLPGGDFLFLVSCTQFIDAETRAKYKHVLVLHESDLPKGRGWSPVAHQILEGKQEITVSLIEAAEKIDCGDIWAQEVAYIPDHALADEISAIVFAVKKRLIARALYTRIEPKKQEGVPTYYVRRTPEDCELDINRTIADQFDLLRICEPRFPAFFRIRGHKYTVEVRKS